VNNGELLYFRIMIDLNFFAFLTFLFAKTVIKLKQLLEIRAAIRFWVATIFLFSSKSIFSNNFSRVRSYISLALDVPGKVVQSLFNLMYGQVKLSCDSHFQNAFTVCSCIFTVITLVRANQRNFFENATTCSKRMRKMLVANAALNDRISTIKLHCDERFITHAFTACSCVFKEITLVVSNQGNYFENASACSKRTLKTTVATQLKFHSLISPYGFRHEASKSYDGAKNYIEGIWRI
jgi:hypothetical protein